MYTLDAASPLTADSAPLGLQLNNVPIVAAVTKMVDKTLVTDILFDLKCEFEYFTYVSRVLIIIFLRHYFAGIPKLFGLHRASDFDSACEQYIPLKVFEPAYRFPT